MVCCREKVIVKVDSEDVGREASAQPVRCVLHADMDAFFASVEQRDHPEYQGRPLVVGGDGPRGVVAAASYEAREFGIRSAMPSFEAKRLCRDLIFLRGDMAKYSQESRRIFSVFSEFSPLVEALSLDEAFLDLTGTERLLGPPAEVGARLRKRVWEETHLVVSVGIAPVKLVAKIASAAAKPDGLIEVLPGEVRDFLAPLPVRRLWGVGPVADKRLRDRGFSQIGDLASAEPERLRSLLGDWGVDLARLARGEDVRGVENESRAISYSEENTFRENVSDHALLESTVLTHAEAVARRLRREAVRGRTVVLKWRGSRRIREGPRGYPLHTRQTTLPQATDDGAVIARAARLLLAEVGPTDAVRLIGVGVSGLEDETSEQLSLFVDPELSGREAPEERAALNRALDEITSRFGSTAVVRASQGQAERAGLSQQVKRGEGSEEDL
ncbi:MAG: DNA polymerase IV [Deltaproteobacteria bacterium]|nr:DNA polymerase IV [Deltaproteobacteria bacterium]